MENKPATLSPEQFQRQLNLLNVPTEFRNTCIMLIQNQSQANMLSENLLMALLVLMKQNKMDEFKIVRKDVKDINGFIDLDIQPEYVSFKLVSEEENLLKI